MTIAIHLLSDTTPEQAEAFASLLYESVEEGASLGYLYGHGMSTFTDFWKGEIGGLSPETGFILYATKGDEIVGVVQCAFATKQTGSHRAEVRKLLVAKSARGQGIAKALMNSLEREAIARGRTLLYLDTERGSDADFLYPKLGWSEFGVIPKYAASPNGELKDCTFYYKKL